MKAIPLSRGYATLVDDSDFEWLTQWKWHVKQSGPIWYAATNSRPNSEGKRRTIFMHVLIFGSTCDHRNRNGLDNQHINLRSATRTEQSRNRKMFKNNSCGSKGVHWHSKLKKWRARIGLDGKRISLGCYESKEEASKAYRDAAAEMFGEFNCEA